jgi:hypothetical protein
LEIAWKELDTDLRSQIKKETPWMGDLGGMLDTIHVLFVFCTPLDQVAIRPSAELRAINEAIRQSKSGRRVVIDTLPAATQNDLRSELLHKNYDVVHFSGHADGYNLAFEGPDGSTSEVPLTSIRSLIENRPTIKCVILNACKSVSSLTMPISPCTIGMDDEIDDNAAIEFSRGFYDAIAAGKTFEEAFGEGTLAVKLAKYDTHYLRLIK